MSFTVDFEEMKGLPQEDYGETGWQGHRRLDCAWGDRYTLINELFDDDNWSWPYTNTSGTTVFTISGYLSKIHVEGFGKQSRVSAGIASYEKASLDVTYRTMSVTGGGNLVSEELETGTDPLPLDSAALKYDLTGSYLAMAKGDRPNWAMEHLVYVRTLYHQASIPGGAYTAVRTVNNAPYASTSLNKTFAAGTLRYAGCRALWSTMVRGRVLATVQYTFLVHPVNWNYFWCSSLGSFYPIVNASNSAIQPYTPADYSTLFT